MSRPAKVKWGKEGRAMSSAWLSERVTVIHRGTRRIKGNPTSEAGELWRGDVWAMVLTYDQWVGQIGERDGVEGGPMEMRFGICLSQDAPVNMSEVRKGDTLIWSNRQFTVTFVEDTVWLDALMIYADGAI